MQSWSAGFIKILCIDLLVMDDDQRERMRKELADLRFRNDDALDRAAVYAANELCETVWRHTPQK